MCRVVTEYRWNADLVLKVAGTPMKPCPTMDGDEGDAWVEDTANPHEPAELDVELVARPASEAEDIKQRAVQRIRITKNDLMRYGYSANCPKCADVKKNNNLTLKHHTEECRARLYKAFRDNNDPKWRKVAQEVGVAEDYEHPPVTEVEVSHEAADELIGASTQQPDRGPTPRLPSPGTQTPAAETPLFARFEDDGAPRTPQRSLPSAIAPRDEAMDTETLRRTALRLGHAWTYG